MQGCGADAAGHAAAWATAEGPTPDLAGSLRGQEVAAALVEAGDVAIVALDAGGRVRYANATAGSLLDGAGGDPVGRCLDDLLQVVPLRDAQPRGDLTTLASWSGDATLRVVDGPVVHAHVGIGPLHRPGVEGHGRLLWWVPITEHHGDLAEGGERDGLTTLANRVGLLAGLGDALERVRDPARVTVIILDLDDFHLVNHVLGHAAGDLLLSAVGRRLQRAAGAGATVARLRGDDFAVLALVSSGERGVAAREASELAERLSMAVSGAYTVAGEEVFVTVRAGVALGDADRDAKAQLRDAEAAAVRAVKVGADVEIHAEQARVEAHQRLVLTNALRQAIPGGELELAWQPEIELTKGRLVGLEALVRWQHPERGLLTPASFLLTAEASGLIVPLGRWVLEEACRQAVTWLARHPGQDTTLFAVNVAPRQLVAPDFVAAVDAALEASGLPAHRLALEITESAILHDLEHAGTALAALSERGVWVAVDDFGTGYSSLSHLIALPVDMLKIDQTFVAQVTEPGATRTVVEAAVGLARTLGITSVAEGVERRAQAEALRRIGCDVGQGYLWSRPLPLAGLDRLIGDPVSTGR